MKPGRNERRSRQNSRFWRYGDIQSFSQSEWYRFEVVSFEDKFAGPKAYNFHLRDVVPAATYDYVWGASTPLRFRPDGGSRGGAIPR